MTNTRAQLRRHPERAVPDEVGAILAQGLVAHVGFTVEGQPFVIPLLYDVDPDAPERLYLHGAKASRALRQLAAGIPVSVAVTLVDGIVYSRTARNHSMNYRSVVGFGTAHPVEDDAAKAAIFARMTRRYIPNRTVGRDYAAPSSNDLRTVEVVEIVIAEWSGKARRGGPNGPGDDAPDAPGTAGVVEVRQSFHP
jgi:nitroimidazol reductase NimA-like FMN-containing flavoprotein (pyridoxamine 5'-phosphate oxidase superfamily)